VTGYASIDGPPDDTRCSFCNQAFADGESKGWMITEQTGAAICPTCIDRGTRLLADLRSRSELKE
jgi:hypothetical protein